MPHYRFCGLCHGYKWLGDDCSTSTFRNIHWTSNCDTVRLLWCELPALSGSSWTRREDKGGGEDNSRERHTVCFLRLLIKYWDSDWTRFDECKKRLTTEPKSYLTTDNPQKICEWVTTTPFQNYDAFLVILLQMFSGYYICKIRKKLLHALWYIEVWPLQRWMIRGYHIYKVLDGQGSFLFDCLMQLANKQYITRLVCNQGNHCMWLKQPTAILSWVNCGQRLYVHLWSPQVVFAMCIHMMSIVHFIW